MSDTPQHGGRPMTMGEIVDAETPQRPESAVDHYQRMAEELRLDRDRLFAAAFEALRLLNGNRAFWNGPQHRAAAVLRAVTEPALEERRPQ